MGGRKKETLLWREQDSLGEAAEKVYLGKESNSEIEREKEKKRSKREREKKELRGKCIKTLTGHSDYVRSVVFSPDG